jgi:hypothetical protein
VACVDIVALLKLKAGLISWVWVVLFISFEAGLKVVLRVFDGPDDQSGGECEGTT